MIKTVHSDSIATQFTALELSGGAAPAGGERAPQRTPGPVSEAQLADLYTYPQSDEPYLRLNFITSLDGAITIDGRSGGLGGDGDGRIFALLRGLADVILVGAGTVRGENYGGARMSPDVQRRRVAEGREPVPAIAVVTANAGLEPDHRIFHDTAVPPIILTSPRADEDRVRRLADVGAQIVRIPEPTDGPGHSVDRMALGAIPRILGDLGAFQILCEGGPDIVGGLLRSGAVDELCLTTAPMLVADDAPRMSAGSDPSTTPMRRRHLLTDDTGTLYARWAAERHGR